MQDKIRDLDAALNMVREELDRLIREAREEGAEAYRNGDTASFNRADTIRLKMQEFAKRVDALYGEWQTVSGRSRPRQRQKQSATPRAHRGELLPERAYVFPILRILHERGGAVSKAEVLVELEKVLGGEFQEADLNLLSNGQVRWQNRSAWVRNYLAEAGLLSRETKPGIWMISDKGRAELAAGDLDATWERMMQIKHSKRSASERS